MGIARTLAYVTNVNDNTVSVISTATATVTATIPVGSAPQAVAFTPAAAVPPLTVTTTALPAATLGQPQLAGQGSHDPCPAGTTLLPFPRMIVMRTALVGALKRPIPAPPRRRGNFCQYYLLRCRSLPMGIVRDTASIAWRTAVTSAIDHECFPVNVRGARRGCPELKGPNVRAVR